MTDTVYVVYRDNAHEHDVCGWESIWASKTGAIAEVRRLAAAKREQLMPQVYDPLTSVKSVEVGESSCDNKGLTVDAIFSAEVRLQATGGVTRWVWRVEPDEIKRDAISDLADLAPKVIAGD